VCISSELLSHTHDTPTGGRLRRSLHYYRDPVSSLLDERIFRSRIFRISFGSFTSPVAIVVFEDMEDFRTRGSVNLAVLGANYQYARCRSGCKLSVCPVRFFPWFFGGFRVDSRNLHETSVLLSLLLPRYFAATIAFISTIELSRFLFTVLDAKDPGSNPGGCKLSVCPVRDCGTESAKAVIIFDSAVIVFYDGRYSRGLSR